ncbi:hypothetical protein OEZ86_009960 [Tetradesmus obliquus]|uniref:Uncharacterized protein n=1 Tax=Tetradesmus obliquus TaxID=3088 RepID=A0ABY8UPJ0_TETOB|nr:hypothetical protein OEZ85_001394 [Tetradesmus obliquus]WIA43498.1 hypothetical protein OEZ86_009960 [Tetradesmus obliquus]
MRVLLSRTGQRAYKSSFGNVQQQGSNTNNTMPQSPSPLHQYSGAAGSSGAVSRGAHIHSRADPVSYTARSDVAASLDRQLYQYAGEKQQEDEYNASYQQQQQLRGMQHLQQRHSAPGSQQAQQPQQQQQQQQQGLASVLAGPMDVSQLWEAAPAASLEQSYEEHPYQQQHACDEEDDLYSYDDEDVHLEDASRDSPPYQMFGEWVH